MAITGSDADDRDGGIDYSKRKKRMPYDKGKKMPFAKGKKSMSKDKKESKGSMKCPECGGSIKNGVCTKCGYRMKKK